MSAMTFCQNYTCALVKKSEEEEVEDEKRENEMQQNGKMSNQNRL